MKELVQVPGVRKWFGDEFTTIQDEIFAVIEGHFGNYSKQFIISGCVVDGTTIGAGIIGLNHADGFKVCRFAGAMGVIFPLYLKAVKTEETRLYLDGDVKPVAEIYAAELSLVNTDSYLELKQDNSTPRFADIIQDVTHRFVTDAEKLSYAGQASAALSTIRNGIAAQLNTLEKLRAYLEGKIDAGGIDPSAIYATIRGGVAVEYDTLQKLLAYTNTMNIAWARLSGVPEFQGSANLATSNIDFSGKPILRKTLAAPTVLSASNLLENKTVTLLITGNYSLTWPMTWKRITGSYNGSVPNLIQLICTNATVGSEEIWFSISQQE